MPTTYEPISTTTLTSTSTNIDFTSIPATYTDLRVVLNALGTSSSVYLRFNSDTGTNYSRTLITGDGASATSTRSTSISRIQSPSTVALSSTLPTLITYDIFSYAGSTFKSILASFFNDKNGSGGVANLVSMWRSTSAITAVNLSTPSLVFSIGTTATLYGIKNA